MLRLQREPALPVFRLPLCVWAGGHCGVWSRGYVDVWVCGLPRRILMEARERHQVSSILSLCLTPWTQDPSLDSKLGRQPASRCNPPSLPCLVLTLQEITGTASSVRACCIWMQFLVCGQQSSNPHSPPSGPSFLSFFLNIFGRVNWDKTIYQGHKISKKHACLSLMLLTPFFFFYNCSLSFTMLSFCSSLVAMKDLL